MGAVFFKDLRLILRDRALVFFSLVLPVIVISLLASALLGGRGGPRISIAVVDGDRGPVAQQLKQALGEYASVVELEREAAVQFVRDLSRGPAALVLPAQLSDNYPRGIPTEVGLLTDPADETSLRTAKVLLLLMEKKLAAENDPFSEQLIVLKEQNLTGNQLTITPFQQNLPGFAIMFALIGVIFSTSLGLHDEREGGTLPRLLIAPAGMTRILLGKLAARFVIGVGQLAFLLVWSHVIFGVPLGNSPAGLAVLICAVILATVTTGLLVGVFTRTRAQVQPLGLGLVVLLSGLGGLWWPESTQPPWMQMVSSVAYTSWAMSGMNDLVLRGRGLDALAQPLGALVVYAAATLAIGIGWVRARQEPA
ncbi:MAG: ABC transporter permease [Candidatus Binatia bacterium]